MKAERDTLRARLKALGHLTSLTEKRYGKKKQARYTVQHLAAGGGAAKRSKKELYGFI